MEREKDSGFVYYLAGIFGLLAIAYSLFTISLDFFVVGQYSTVVERGLFGPISVFLIPAVAVLCLALAVFVATEMFRERYGKTSLTSKITSRFGRYERLLP